MKRLERVLQILIFSEMALVVLAVAAAYSLESSLPDELRGYLDADAADASLLRRRLLVGLWLVVAVSTVLSWVGLLNLIREARPLYLGSWCAYLVLILLDGPVVETAVGAVVGTLTALVGGAILGLVYLTELRTELRPLIRSG